ncbi:SRPBCC domain-containing protein [Myceligenerans crystallogenes]|uniref:SRPBCC domain-containing protein n=1 Tax=Myceligenerans crystallogenes TaxID=316335 RepID=A0ABN2N7S1_9MICO
MTDILHRIGAQAPLEKVYEAIATPAGVAAWWTQQTTGEGTVGSDLDTEFRTLEGELVGTIGMRVAELDPAAGVVDWLVTDGPEEWNGTHIRFELHEDEDWTIVMFRHTGWAEPVEFLHHCSTKWASFLLSLKKYVETGEGEPSPRDVRISNWH